MLDFPDVGHAAPGHLARLEHAAPSNQTAPLVTADAAAAGRQGLHMKRTYQASKVRRARTHGFLVRMKTRGGRAVINARRAKGRKRLAV
jgi:large subunit ribosomal protein L34